MKKCPGCSVPAEPHDFGPTCTLDWEGLPELPEPPPRVLPVTYACSAYQCGHQAEFGTVRRSGALLLCEDHRDILGRIELNTVFDRDLAKVMNTCLNILETVIPMAFDGTLECDECEDPAVRAATTRLGRVHLLCRGHMDERANGDFTRTSSVGMWARKLRDELSLQGVI